MAKEVKEFISAAIKGAHATVEEATEKLEKAIDIKGSNHLVAFPNTDYYLPLIYGLTGTKVEKLSHVEQVLRQVRKLSSKVPRKKLWLPYLGDALDAGMAALFAGEIIEAIKYVIGPEPEDNIWLGAPDDAIVRKHSRKFVDGSASGFVVAIGAAPEAEMAAKLVRENLWSCPLLWFCHSCCHDLWRDKSGRLWEDTTLYQGSNFWVCALA
ncbi:MAG: hypothetical protein QMD66_04885 [Actinomycetota bacterium]|nr:hypothetical protein [Actinomycetota bacterium]MDI6822184.1 hypothetical protein [Actinomycetota bacterium]